MSFLDFLPLVDTEAKAAFHLQWAAQNEKWVRQDERRLIGDLLTAAVSKKQHVQLQHALRKLDPETARTCGTIIHLLTSMLAEESAEQAA